jgi:serine/threonine-protein phosphatase PGAM5
MMSAGFGRKIGATMQWALLSAALCFTNSDAATLAPAAPFVRTIYLIRHGSYVPDPNANPETGPVLTTLGIAQARLVAARMRGMPLHFDSIVSSTLTRAAQTAAEIRPMFPEVAKSATPLLVECTPPLPMAVKGESAAEQAACKSRLDEAFAKFFTPARGGDKNDMLVCHGNVIRYFVTKALGVDTRAWLGMSVAHTSITIIQVHADGSFRVNAVGDAGHVPPNMLSWGTDADPQLVSPR